MGKTVRDLLRGRLGVTTTPFVNRVAPSIGTAVIAVLRNDPSRVSWLFVNLSINTIFLTPVGIPGPTNGILVGPNGGSVSAVWDEDGEVVAWEWRAVADGAGSTFFLQENIIATES